MQYLAIWFLLLQVANSALERGLPAAAGVYYHQNDASWIPLRSAPIAEMKTSGMGTFIETGGYTNLEMSIVCSGAKASLRIPVSKPVFGVREVFSSKDVTLVKLSQKKNKRIFKASSAAATVENKGGFAKKDIQKVAITANPDNSFSITPEENLKPGEYLLIFGYAKSAFDFGIDPPE